VGRPERAGPQGRGAARSRVAAGRRAQGPARALRQGQEETSSPQRSLARRARASARTRDTEVRRAARHSTAAEAVASARRSALAGQERPAARRPPLVGQTQERSAVVRCFESAALRSSLRAGQTVGEQARWSAARRPPLAGQERAAPRRPPLVGQTQERSAVVRQARRSSQERSALAGPPESTALRPSLRRGPFSATIHRSRRAGQAVGEQGRWSAAGRQTVVVQAKGRMARRLSPARRSIRASADPRSKAAPAKTRRQQVNR